MSETSRYEKINKKLILSVFAAGTMCLCGIIVETALNISFPTLMKEFSVSTSEVQWLTTGFMLMTSFLVPISSFLNDRFSRRSLFLTGFFLFLAGIFMDIAARQFQLLLLGRLFQGLGMGIGMPLMFNIILSKTPLSHMGLMMGIGNLNIAAAPAIGPVFGGLITEYLSWRYIFVFLLPLLAAALAAGLYAIDKEDRHSSRSFDFFSSFLIVFIFTSLLYGLNRTGETGLRDGQVILCAIVFILSSAVFAVRTWNSASPVIRLQILKTAPFSLFLCSIGALQIASLAYSFLLPNYMQISEGASAMEAGLLLFPGALAGAVLSPVGGRLLDLWGSVKPIAIGGLCMISASLLFALFGIRTGAFWFSAFYLLYMAGIGMVLSNTITHSLASLPPASSPDGNALINTMQQVACAVGISVASAAVAASQSGFAMGTEAFAQATRWGTEHGFYIVLGSVTAAFLFQYAAFHFSKDRT
jgi:EmrB/QacA subfamily drug resistance transporter